ETGQRPAVARETRDVSDREDAAVPRHAAVVPDLDSPLRKSPTERREGFHTAAPTQHVGFLCAASGDDPVGGGRFHAFPEPQVDTQRFELPPRRTARALVELGEDAVFRFEEQDLNVLPADRAIVPGDHPAAELRERTGEFHAARAAAQDGKPYRLRHLPPRTAE